MTGNGLLPYNPRGFFLYSLGLLTTTGSRVFLLPQGGVFHVGNHCKVSSLTAVSALNLLLGGKNPLGKVIASSP